MFYESSFFSLFDPRVSYKNIALSSLPFYAPHIIIILTTHKGKTTRGDRKNIQKDYTE